MFRYFDTDDFRIRKIDIADSNEIYQNWAQQINVARYTTWMPHKSCQETKDYVENCLKGWHRDNYTWTIEDKATLEIAGSFAARLNGHKVEIGYLLAQQYWGKGIMTEVVSSFITQAFKLDTVERVGAVCDVENPASRRVMEKAGMNYEGILASWMIHPNMGPKARDCYCLSITREHHEHLNGFSV